VGYVGVSVVRPGVCDLARPVVGFEVAELCLVAPGAEGIAHELLVDRGRRRMGADLGVRVRGLGLHALLLLPLLWLHYLEDLSLSRTIYQSQSSNRSCDEPRGR
jgi:hypothetical protein